VAALLSAEFGQVVSAQQVSYLIEHRLQPVGITVADPGAVAAGGTTPMTMTSDPLLALKFRVGVVPERAVWHLAGVFRPMFWPPVIVAGLAALVAWDVAIIDAAGAGDSVGVGSVS
jgi:putative peptide zinc metalloprotease protein